MIPEKTLNQMGQLIDMIDAVHLIAASGNPAALKARQRMLARLGQSVPLLLEHIRDQRSIIMDLQTGFAPTASTDPDELLEAGGDRG